MSTATNTREFTTSIDVAASPDLVWAAITEAAGLERWFAPEAEVVPGVGGTVRWSWPNLHEWPQTIEVWEPGARLRTRYDSPVEDGQGGRVPLFIDWHLTGTEGGARTTLRLVQSGFGPGAEFDQEYDGISKGWVVELSSLKLSLEAHAGANRQLVHTQRMLEVDLDQAWARLVGPEGFDCGPIDRLAPGERFAFAGFEGEALVCHDRQFCGRATSHGDAWLRLVVEDCGGQSFVWLWLASYGRPQAELDATQARFDAVVERLFGAA